MRVSYNKLWKMLIDKNMKKMDLLEAIEMSPNTLAKLGCINGCPKADLRIFAVRYRGHYGDDSRG